MRASILCHYAGQSASVALCMYQALQKADSSLASLCSGPDTGLARWVRIKKNRESWFYFSPGLFQSHRRVCHPGYQVSVALSAILIILHWKIASTSLIYSFHSTPNSRCFVYVHFQSHNAPNLPPLHISETGYTTKWYTLKYWFFDPHPHTGMYITMIRITTYKVRSILWSNHQTSVVGISRKWKFWVTKLSCR